MRMMKTTLTALCFLLTLFSVDTFAQYFPYSTFRGPTAGVSSVTFSADGTRLASGSHDTLARLWDISTSNQIGTFGADLWRINGIALSPDGKQLAIGAGPNRINTLIVLEVSTGKLLWQLQADSGWTASVAFSPDGLTLASAGNDGVIKLWDVSTGDQIRTLRGHTAAVQSVTFSADGKMIASGSADHTSRLWEASTGKPIRILSRHTDGVEGVAFSPDSKTLASGSLDTTIRLWSANTGRLLHTLTGHTDKVGGDAAFSADNRVLASGSEDGNIRLWDVHTGQHLHTLTGLAQPVWDCAFSPDGKQLATGHADGNVLLWEFPDTRLHITPAPVVSPAIGQQVTVNVSIVAGADVAAYEVSLAFDGTALRHVSSAKGDYLPANAFFGPPVVSNNTVTLSATALTGASNGDGTLATVTFEVLDTKDSFIDIVDANLIDSQDADLHLLTHGVPVEGFAFGDINRDGVVNVQDLVLVSSSFGQPVPEAGNPADVNADGKVDIRDLVAVAAVFGQGAAAAPSVIGYQTTGQLTAADVQQWLTQARQANLTDPTSHRGILFLETLLAALAPKETALLANYPNPFNPETWIPYQLAEAADVALTIYAVDGTVVRNLTLGHQPIGIYADKRRAAYWDGRNAQGEPVASGVYFYTLTAGDFTATRKMLIQK